MKFTNEKKIPYLKFGYFVLSALLMSMLAYVYLIKNSAYLAIKEVVIFLLLSLLAFIYWYRRAKFIEYDSSGLGLVFITKGILLSDFTNYREQRIEIPKEKLLKYKVVNLLVTKKVYIYIKSKHRIKKVGLDISFLSKNKTKALKMSLNKIVRENSSK